MTKFLLTTAAVLTLAGVAHAAPAVSADDDRQAVHISTQGVNFNDAAQAREFYGRLERATHRMCQSGWGDQVIAGNEDLTCVRENMRDAVRKVDAPLLTAMVGANYDVGAKATAFAADAR